MEKSENKSVANQFATNPFGYCLKQWVADGVYSMKKRG
jgi:hypothetical protein